MNSLKKKSLISSLPGIIICGVLALVFLWLSVPGLVKYLMGPADMETLDYEGDIDGKYVSGVLYCIYDSYAETKEDSVKLVSREYIIDAGDYYYMGMLVQKSDVDQAEALLNATYDYWAGDDPQGTALVEAMYVVEGTIHEMPDDSQRYYYQDVENYFEDPAEMFLPYYLEVGKIGNAVLSGLVVFFVLAIVFVALTAFFLIRVLTGANQKMIKQYIASSSNPAMAQGRVDTFLASAQNNDGLRYNDMFICGQNGATTIFVEAEKLVWAYQKTITHKRNFITVGHSYYLVLGLANGKRYEISMKNENATLQYLQDFTARYPKVIIGYTDDLDKVFRKDLNSFLKLKYMAAEQQTSV